MKSIAYTLPDGQLHICHPAPWARLIAKAVIAGQERVFEPPVPADKIFRDQGVVPVEWAETEEVFVERIRIKDVPPQAVRYALVDAAELPDRKDRARWALVDDRVVVL